jgi:hypothetical protein
MTAYVQNSLFLIGTALLVVLVFMSVFIIVDQIRLSHRQGVPRHEFVENFRQNNIPPEISSTVYDHYKSLAVSKKFGLSPEDSYEAVLHMVHDDIDDDAEFLVGKLGMVMPIEPILREWPTEIKTIKDMIMWLDWIRQHQPTNSSIHQNA